MWGDKMNNTTSIPEAFPLCFGNVKIDIRRRSVSVDETAIPLSTREYELLLFLCQHKDWALSKSQLYQAIWGEIAFESNHAVENAIYRIRKAIYGAGGNVTIDTIVGFGYRLSIPRE